MSNEFNLMLSEDLAEVSDPIMRQLIESGNFNMRGIAALLQLASCMMAEIAGAAPSDADHKVASDSFVSVAGNPLATVSLIAQLAKGFIMVHHGYGREHGPIRKES